MGHMHVNIVIFEKDYVGLTMLTNIIHKLYISYSLRTFFVQIKVVRSACACAHCNNAS